MLGLEVKVEQSTLQTVRERLIKLLQSRDS